MLRVIMLFSSWAPVTEVDNLSFKYKLFYIYYQSLHHVLLQIYLREQFQLISHQKSHCCLYLIINTAKENIGDCLMHYFILKIWSGLEFLYDSLRKRNNCKRQWFSLIEKETLCCHCLLLDINSDSICTLLKSFLFDWCKEIDLHDCYVLLVMFNVK